MTDDDLYVYVSTHDIDWFAVDIDDRLAFFATGGRGAVPPSVASSLDDMSEVSAYLLNELNATADYRVSSKALSHAEIQSSNQQAVTRYLHDFEAMAKRGLYAFDAFLWPEGGNPYFRVALPREPLSIVDLPATIRDKFERTRFSVRFAEIEKLEVADFRDELYPRSEE